MPLARRTILRIAVGALVLGFILTVGTGGYFLLAGPKQAIGTGDPLGSYSAAGYAALLTAVVGTDDGLVDYQLLSTSYVNELDQYLDAVGRFGPNSTPDAFATETDWLAFYLNAYNAIMLKQIVRHEIPDSVNKLWFVTDRWLVDGKWMTLDSLEQKLIRPTFNEARIHFALVCAAMDCPPLRSEPYRGDRLDEQLDDQGARFLATEKSLRLDNGIAHVNLIFKWYSEDFDGVGGLKAVMLRYLPHDDRRRGELEDIAQSAFEFRPYDWSVNDRNQ